MSSATLFVRAWRGPQERPHPSLGHGPGGRPECGSPAWSVGARPRGLCWAVGPRWPPASPAPLLPSCFLAHSIFLPARPGLHLRACVLPSASVSLSPVPPRATSANSPAFGHWGSPAEGPTSGGMTLQAQAQGMSCSSTSPRRRPPSWPQKRGGPLPPLRGGRAEGSERVGIFFLSFFFSSFFFPFLMATFALESILLR